MISFRPRPLYHQGRSRRYSLNRRLFASWNPYNSQSANRRLLPVWESDGVVHRCGFIRYLTTFYQIMILWSTNITMGRRGDLVELELQERFDVTVIIRLRLFCHLPVLLDRFWRRMFALLVRLKVVTRQAYLKLSIIS